MANNNTADTKVYNFGEKTKETLRGKEVPVIVSSKYEATKKSAITILKEEKFKLDESDFWILKNFAKNDTFCIYSGLLITHDGLLKINESLEESKKFDQKYCSDPIAFDYAGKKGMYMTYRDERDGMFEVAEVSTDNCRNEYPFSMLSKRMFDRVVKRKANMIGIYSIEEADEFDSETKSEIEREEKLAFMSNCKLKKVDFEEILKKFGWEPGNKIDRDTFEIAKEYLRNIPEVESTCEKTDNPIAAYKKTVKERTEAAVEEIKEEPKAEDIKVEEPKETPKVEEPVAAKKTEEVIEEVEAEIVEEAEAVSDGLIHASETAGLTVRRLDGTAIKDVPKEKLEQLLNCEKAFTPECFVEIKDYLDSLK